jgi:hypothetical protein
MRILCALVLLMLVSAPASSEIIYARPDGDPSTTRYLWGDDVVTNGVPLADAIASAKAADGSRPLEIRLLRRAEAQDTSYSVDLGSTGSALRWHGSERNGLIIRGQVDRSASLPRALTIIFGKGSLRQILCEPQGVDLCTASPSEGPIDKRRDLFDYLAGELETENGDKRGQARNPDIPLRTNCLLFWEAAFVEIADVGFRDCWIAAVATYASSNIALRGTVIEGAAYAFLAVARQGVPESAHTFEIVGNVWRQSSSTYRSSPTRCDIHNDWSCPVSIWADVPWAVVHHYFWSPLNGALFRAKDILGNVRIADNHVIDAYNGVRVRLSKTCVEDPRCRERANAGFEIVGNTFEKIRDNAIEPEERAAYWIIKHNTFIDVYAPISTDGVAGHDFLVFGNIFALDDVPGSKCLDEGWAGSRQFLLTLGGGGRWSAEEAEGGEARCSTHVMGTVIKMGVPDDNPDSALLDRILFFNNSLRTRSPLFRGTPGLPIISYDNAVEFIGCGTAGAPSCRQSLANDPSCAGEDVWTQDRQAIFAECFPLLDRQGRRLAHMMRFNAYNRAPGPRLNAINKDYVVAPLNFVRPAVSGGQMEIRSFAIRPGEVLANGGCRVGYMNGDIECVGNSGTIGALLPNGNWFDINLPFGFPFTDLLRNANGTALPK